MVNYVITKFSVRGEYDAVLAAMETHIETLTNTVTLQMVTIVERGNEFVGMVLSGD